MNDHPYREWAEDLHAQLVKRRWKDKSASLGPERDPSIVWRVPHPQEGVDPSHCISRFPSWACVYYYLKGALHQT